VSAPTSSSYVALEALAASGARAVSAERRRMLVIVNPYATTVSDRLRHLVVYALQGRYEVTAIDTESRNHATELCREAAHEGYDVVVTFGGDGTVNEAVNGLIGSDTPIFPLPGGNTNVLCRMLGIPNEIVDATEHLLGLADRWNVRHIDLPLVNERAFTFSSGVGLDATVVRRVDARPKLKARFGPWFFTSAGVTSFFKDYLVNPARMDVTTDHGERTNGVTVIVQNGDPYTYFRDRPVALAEDAALDSGSLSALVLERVSPLDVPTIAARALIKRLRLAKHRHIAQYTNVHEVTIRSVDDRLLPMQVDGDYVGSVAEAVYTVRPGALAVVA
jgi:diacylglycerol kinase family enzyme